jgi:hypothetical protein
VPKTTLSNPMVQPPALPPSPVDEGEVRTGSCAAAVLATIFLLGDFNSVFFVTGGGPGVIAADPYYNRNLTREFPDYRVEDPS